MRIGINEYYMNIAVQVSLRSTCIRRKVGAVIVKDNEIAYFIIVIILHRTI